MAKFVDLTGQKFNRLTVLKRVGTNKQKCATWLCVCDCGNKSIVTTAALKSGHVKSCGCLNIDRNKECNTKHGMRHSRLYSIYTNMKQRCYNKNDSYYKDYGGRGIEVCKEWKDSFMAFYKWAVNNGYKENLTLDRIDTNGNYEPSNCRWATQKEQQNNRRSNRLITYNGETHTIAEWSEITGINYQTLHSRINTLKWNTAKALGF